MPYNVPELRRRKETDRRLSFSTYMITIVLMLGLLIGLGVAMGLSYWAQGVPWDQWDYRGFGPHAPFYMAGWGIAMGIIGVALSVILWWYQWQLYKRRNEHVERAKQLKMSISRWLREKHNIDMSPTTGSDFYLSNREQYRSTAYFIIWVILTYIIGPVGLILTLVAWYWLTRDYAVHEQGEWKFYRRVSEELEKKEISLDPGIRAPLPERNMVLYVVLMIVPGINIIWSIWWSYVLFRDPNVHFDTHEHWESQLERIIEQQISPGSSDQSLRILRERYAKGEITREEFERMKQDLLER